MKTPEKLWPALRQYRHNNSDGLVMGFDCEDTIKEFKLMQAEIDELKARINALGWVLESEGKITKTDWSRIRDQHKGEWYEQSKK